MLFERTVYVTYTEEVDNCITKGLIDMYVLQNDSFTSDFPV